MDNDEHRFGTEISRGRRPARTRIRRSVRADSPLYASASPPSRARSRRRLRRARRRRSPSSSRSSSGWRSPARGASSPPGRRSAGVDVGGLTPPRGGCEAGRRSSSSARRSPWRSSRTDETYSLRRESARRSQPDWTAAVAAAGRAGDGFGPLRGFRRLRARVFGAEVLPRLTVSNAALEYALDKIAARRRSRAEERGARPRTGLRIEVVPERDRDAPRSRRGRGGHRPLARTGRARRPARRRSRSTVTAPAVSGGDARRCRGARARWRLRARSSLTRRGSELPRAALAARRAAPRCRGTARRRSRSAEPPPTPTSGALANASARPPRDAGFAVYGDAVQVVPARDGPRAQRAAGGPRDPARRDAAGEPCRAAARRPRGARAHDRRGARDGHRPAHVLVQDVLLRARPDRITNLQLGVARARRDARRAPEGPSRSTTRSASARSSAASGRLP